MRQKITKEDILAGKYRQTEPHHMIDVKVRRHSLPLWVQNLLFLALIFGLYQGCCYIHDERLKHLIVTDALTVSNQPVTVKEVEIWSGDRFGVDDEYTFTGTIIDGEYSKCPAANTEGLSLAIKNEQDQTICLGVVGITRSLRNKLRRMVKKEALKEKYKGRTIYMRGWGNNDEKYDKLVNLDSHKWHVRYADYDMYCAESYSVFLSDLDVE